MAGECERRSLIEPRGRRRVRQAGEEGPHAREAAVEPLAPVVRLWILRMLMRLGGVREFVRHGCVPYDDLALALGLGGYRGVVEDGPGAEAATVRALRRMHRHAERTVDEDALPEPLASNLELLGSVLGLEPGHRRLLAFAVLMQEDAMLEEAMGLLPETGMRVSMHRLSVILGMDLAEIERALAPDSPLVRAGLVRAGLVRLKARSRRKREMLELGSERLTDLAVRRFASEDALMRFIAPPAPGPELTLASYRHLGDVVHVAVACLKEALASGRAGVNVLLYGQAGTGKTQLARALAAAAGAPLHEVPVDGEDGEPLQERERAVALAMAQRALAGTGKLLLLDEAEEVVGDLRGAFGLLRLLGGDPEPARAKEAWLLRLLETSPTPTIWVVNDPSPLHEALIRRFDVVLSVPPPPSGRRIALYRRHGLAWLPHETLRRLSVPPHLAPGVAARAADVAARTRSRLGRSVRQRLPAVVEGLVDETLRAMGRPDLRASGARRWRRFDPDAARADTDLRALARNLKAARCGRLCFAGPPGTGKTACAWWLAERVGMHVLARRASDLVSPYVGMTEALIARAFRAAERQGALLLIDEADTFLLSREEGMRSWELSMVNEMLTQMEEFEGILVMCTNRPEFFDNAALRRFDMTVRFSPCGPDEVVRLFRRTCRELGLGEPDRDTLDRVAALDGATPGDFAQIRRRHRLRPLSTPGDLLASLRAEIAGRNGKRRPIGYLWS